MDRLVITGFVPVNVTELLDEPLTVTMTDSARLATPAGTTATMEVLLQLVVEAVTPPNLTMLVPLVAPKLLPVMVTEVPVAPEVGERLEMDGGVGVFAGNVRE